MITTRPLTPAPAPFVPAPRHEATAALRPALRALAEHDADTLAHTRRVVRLARAFAAALGLNETDEANLLLGAALHDLGKLAVPTAVLNSAEALTAHESALLRAHPGVGVNLARRLGVTDRDVLDVIEFHHERWDGRGYGEGLRGERIPLLARVLAIVDVYDALTSVRAYKKAWTREAALAELRRGAGRAFDPRLVAVFEKLMTVAVAA